MNDYPNWFAMTAEPLFRRFLAHAKDQPVRALQIGVYRGDASVWLLENALTHPDSHLTDVDTWEGSSGEGHDEFDWDDIYDQYMARTDPWVLQGKIERCRMTSRDFFESGAWDNEWDFIYIDGSHRADDVLRDGLNAWERLADGGILVFDDYSWGLDRPTWDRPKEAIDGLIDVFGARATMLHRGAQVWLAKHPADPERVVPGTVGVGFCSGTTTITPEWRLSYNRLLMADQRAAKRIVAEHSQVVGGTAVPDARNRIVRQFLEAKPKAEWLWFVDTDATFGPDIVEQLLSVAHPVERPIVGGLAFRLTYGTRNHVNAAVPQITPMVYIRKDNRHYPLVKYPIDRLVKVDGLPTHCLIIHRSVLEDPRWQEDDHIHKWFRMYMLGDIEISEDFFFCWKAQQLGYPIHCYTKAKTGHEKTMVFDEDVYLKWYPEVADEMSKMQIKDGNVVIVSDTEGEADDGQAV